MARQLECPSRKERPSTKVIAVRFTTCKAFLDEKTSCRICDELFALVDDGRDSDLFLDFGNVEYLTAQMLGTLVIVNKKLRNKDRHLTIGNLTPLVHEVLKVMKLDKVLDLRGRRADGPDWHAGRAGGSRRVSGLRGQQRRNRDRVCVDGGAPQV